MPSKASRVKGLRLKPKVAVRRYSPNQSTRLGPIEAVCLHSTESPNRKGTSDLEAIGGLFANPGFDASSHVGVDADGHSARYVNDEAKAWTVGALNSATLNIEQIGYASQGRASWRKQVHLLRETARWIARWSIRHGIPIRKGKVAGGRVTRSGVITHKQASDGGAGTTHWDPGDYPLGYVLWLARGFKAALILTRQHKN